MDKILHYKGYTGSVNYTEEDGCFWGKVLGLKALLLYEGTNVEELEADFENAVEDYLVICKENGVEPKVSLKDEE